MRWGRSGRPLRAAVVGVGDSGGSGGAEDPHGDNLSAAAEKGAAANVHSVQDVRDWLRRAGFEQYEDVFLVNEVDADVLKTLTSEELRDDLGITNLRHRRDILDAVRRLVSATASVKVDALPEHGRILDHLSNVRTYHSWIRLGVQLFAFAIVTLRLAPNFRGTALVTASSSYFATIGIIALLYGVFRYKAVIAMIEQSGASTPKYNPDRVGVVAMLVLVLIASVISLTLILIHGF
jgi:uncharacterized membrane protein YidH (DUF202 family)